MKKYQITANINSICLMKKERKEISKKINLFYEIESDNEQNAYREFCFLIYEKETKKEKNLSDFERNIKIKYFIPNFDDVKIVEVERFNAISMIYEYGKTYNYPEKIKERINFVSLDFAKKFPKWKEMNETNDGIYNCGMTDNELKYNEYSETNKKKYYKYL